jgi:flagellar basal body-associated protein FliL
MKKKIKNSMIMIFIIVGLLAAGAIAYLLLSKNPQKKALKIWMKKKSKAHQPQCMRRSLSTIHHNQALPRISAK